MLHDVVQDITNNFGATSTDAVLQMDDQRMYTRWVAQNPDIARVDTEGLLFHTLHSFEAKDFSVSSSTLGAGVVWSHATKTAPLVIHGNGNGCSLLFTLVAQLGYLLPEEQGQLQGDEEACWWPFNSF